MKLKTCVAGAALVTLAASGCSAFSDDGGDGDGVAIAAAIYPLAFVAEQVGGQYATVDLLTQPGQEPHDLEPTIAETALISGADLVLQEDGLQPGVDAAIEQNADGTVLEAAAIVGLQPFADHDHGDGDEDHSADDGHDHEGDLDPHFWLDPIRMAALADAVADALSEIDADHADSYHANAAGMRTSLETLDHEFNDGLAQCERDTIVVSHDAFGYLGKYGVEVAPIAGLSPEAEPTPSDLAELHELIEVDGITTVFGERLAPPRLAETLAEDAGVTTAILDPIEGLTDDTADEDYFSLMRQNLDALRKANDCR